MKNGNKIYVTVTNKNINWNRQFAPSTSNLFSNSQFPKWSKYHPSPFEEFLMFIPVFTLPESYKGALIRYTAYLKLYILYYSPKIAGIRVKIILFHFFVTR